MLNGKVIVITGASRGIGREVAKSLAKNGAKVVLIARTISELESLHDEIVKANHEQPSIYPFNLCSATLEDYDDLRRALDKEYSKIDGLIHNAGILGALSPIEHYDIQKWYQVLQVNLNAPFILTQSLLPLLKRSKDASIIFTLAKVASKPKANWGAYAIASSGCKTMMQMLADECQNYKNIRVNAIEPDKIQTRLRAMAYPAEDQLNLVQAEDIVKSYIHLLSRSSNKINGSIYTIEAT